MRKAIFVICVLLSTYVTEALGQGGGFSLSFDGVDDYVELGDVFNDIELPVTMSAWVYVRGTGTYFILRSDDPNSASGTHYGLMFLIQGNTISAHFGDGRGAGLENRRGKRATVAPLTEQWHHIALVMRGATDMSLYLNGEDVGGSYEGRGGPMQLSNWSGRIGRTTLFGPWYYNGELDELRVWDRALTQDEIRTNMHRPNSVSDEALVAEWSFDEGEGQETQDQSTQNAHGVLGNSAAADHADPIWQASTAPIGSAFCFSGIADRSAMWSVMPRSSSGGLSLEDASFLRDKGDFVVFSHNESTRFTTEDLPETVGLRWSRTWCFDVSDAGPSAGGTLSLAFDAEEAGMVVPSLGIDDYVLLHRAAPDKAFRIVTDETGDPLTATFEDGQIEFQHMALSGANSALDGEYTVGQRGVAPVLTRTLGDIEIFLGGPAFALDLTQVFADPNDLDLAFSVSSTNPNVASVAIEGNVLRIGALDMGLTRATLSAINTANLSVRVIFDVLVSPNAAPTRVTSISALALLPEGAPATIDLNTVFEDADGDVLEYGVLVLHESIVSAAVSASLLTVAPVSLGETRVIVVANDGKGGVVQAIFKVRVRTNNAPEVVQAIADTTLLVGASDAVIDLTSRFADVDGDSLVFVATSSNEQVVAATVVNGSLVLAANISGTSLVTVSAQDGFGASVAMAFIVSVNTAPLVVQDVGDLVLYLGDPALMLPLHEVFADPEREALHFRASSADTTIVTVTLDGSTVAIAGIARGSTTIALTAVDERGAATDVDVQVEVVVNAAPVIAQTIPDTTLLVGSVGLSQDLTDVFSDADDDSLSYAVTSSNAAIAVASVTSSVLTVRGLATGQADIQVIAQDERAEHVSLVFTVDVHTVPEVISPLADISLIVGGDDFTASLRTVFADSDGDTLGFSVTSSDEAVVTVDVAGQAAPILVVRPVAVGEAVVTVQANDGRGGEVETAFTVLVPTGVEIESASDVPYVFRLEQNYPNPFTHSTTFAFELPETSTVRLTVFNQLGVEVATVVEKQYGPGRYEVSWRSAKYSSGTYFYKLTTDQFTSVKKLVLIN